MAETDTNWSPVQRVYPIHATASYESAYTDTPSMPSVNIDPYFAYRYITENSLHKGGEPYVDPEVSKDWEEYMEQVKQKQTGPYVDPYYLYRHRGYYEPRMYKDNPNRGKQIPYYPIVTVTPILPTYYISPTDYPDY